MTGLTLTPYVMCLVALQTYTQKGLWREANHVCGGLPAVHSPWGCQSGVPPLALLPECNNKGPTIRNKLIAYPMYSEGVALAAAAGCEAILDWGQPKNTLDLWEIV